MRKEFSLLNYQELAEFRYELRKFIHFSEQTARAGGIEPQQQQLLLVVKGMPDGKLPTISNIAERLQLQHHSTVELIDRLEERELVERHRDELDQRRVLIQITPQGEEVLQELSFHNLEELRTAAPSLVRTLNALIKEGIHSGE
ncbi:MAG TPA: MarR family transcriptional regulator [Ktedonobacteraceae bacterium]|nr:MarR family transcriptional regulator [Ktedonobacteraceae bacterium]